MNQVFASFPFEDSPHIYQAIERAASVQGLRAIRVDEEMLLAVEQIADTIHRLVRESSIVVAQGQTPGFTPLNDQPR